MKKRFPEIPKSIVYNAFNDKIPVLKSLPEDDPERDAHGCYDQRTGNIHINPDSPEIIQWITLVHEYMHVVETMLINQGLRKRGVGEQFVTICSAGIVGMLALNGMLKDFPSKTIVKNELKKHLELYGKEE